MHPLAKGLLGIVITLGGIVFILALLILIVVFWRMLIFYATA